MAHCQQHPPGRMRAYGRIRPTVLAAHLKATLSQFVAVLREAEGSLGRTLHFYLLQVPRAQRPSPSASAHSTAPRPA